MLPLTQTISNCGHRVRLVSGRTACPVPTPRTGVACRAQSNFSKDFHDINQTLDALISKVSSSPSNSSPSGAEATASTSQLEGYVCDENGCVLVTPTTKAPARATDATDDGLALEELLSGPNWSLGLRTDMDPDGYCAVVGGLEWTVSMTSSELKDFVTALQAIRAALSALVAKQAGTKDSEGAPPLRAKWDLRTVIMEATADPSAKQDHFHLTFMIGAGGLRAITGRWSPSTVAEVLQALDANLPGFKSAAGAAAAEGVPEPATAGAR